MLWFFVWTRLHNPYRIGSCPSDDPRHGCTRQMDPCILFAVIELRSEDVFPVAVCSKVDGTCGDDADEGWAEAFGEGSRRFVVVNIFDHMACFDEMVEGRLCGGEGGEGVGRRMKQRKQRKRGWRGLRLF